MGFHRFVNRVYIGFRVQDLGLIQGLGQGLGFRVHKQILGFRDINQFHRNINVVHRVLTGSSGFLIWSIRLGLEFQFRIGGFGVQCYVGLIMFCLCLFEVESCLLLFWRAQVLIALRLNGFNGVAVQGLGFRVQGLGFWVLCSGFRLQGSWFLQALSRFDGLIGFNEGGFVQHFKWAR